MAPCYTGLREAANNAKGLYLGVGELDEGKATGHVGLTVLRQNQATCKHKALALAQVV